MSKKNQAVYLIPLPIVEGALHTLSPEVITHTAHITHYFAEDLRVARRFIKSLHPKMVIETLEFSEITKHEGADKTLFRKWLKEGHNIGIMSDAGCPGIADPGADLVNIAHLQHAKVMPLTGPSSILLALMASGLNGQSFAFNGYLPVKDPMRSKRITYLEAHSAKEKQTQLFIETPYRNNSLLADMLKNCQSHTKICIAQNITGDNAFIKTKSVADWRQDIPVLEKFPAIFLMLGY
ncbi:SAM-dependent methyltransferase [Flavipsychrobacter stenotrophus]|uniref:SAM-dependent methyltransferase n=1 Tax=Flavipsychrobacter stenotrophus TaxID=2077091 RepID=UPI00196A46A3|nr:SAM-dependent methyltransferase [Flavipsychrobacter stenotrophus]